MAFGVCEQTYGMQESQDGNKEIQDDEDVDVLSKIIVFLMKMYMLTIKNSFFIWKELSLSGIPIFV